MKYRETDRQKDILYIIFDILKPSVWPIALIVSKEILTPEIIFSMKLLIKANLNRSSRLEIFRLEKNNFQLLNELFVFKILKSFSHENFFRFAR